MHFRSKHVFEKDPNAMTTEARSTNGAAYIHGRFVPIAEATISVLIGASPAPTRPMTSFTSVTACSSVSPITSIGSRPTCGSAASPSPNHASVQSILNRVVALTGLRDAYVAMVALRGRPPCPAPAVRPTASRTSSPTPCPGSTSSRPRCRNAAPISGFRPSPRARCQLRSHREELHVGRSRERAVGSP